MTDFEYASLVALVQAYGAPAILECVEEIAEQLVEDTAEEDA